MQERCFKKQGWPLLMILALLLAMIPMGATPVEAAPEDYFKIWKNDSYTTNDGKFVMSFTIQCLYTFVDSTISARVVNSAGKEIFTWTPKDAAAGSTVTRKFSADYRGLPTGKYSFKLTCKAGFSDRAWTWDYTINHTRNESFSFGDCTKVNFDGKIQHRWYVNCKNLKGQKVTMKIYNSAGNLLCSLTGPARATNDEVGWFTWNGTDRNGRKCPSGTYLVQLTASGSTKVVEKYYKLTIT